MPLNQLTPSERRHITSLVGHYKKNVGQFSLFLDQLRILFSQPSFTVLVHSLKWRVKDPTHLKDKLVRKALEAKERRQEFGITTDNLFSMITDLAGFRILHLHTQQFSAIHQAILERLQEQQYPIIEGPRAKTWDDESRHYFREIGIETEDSATMYTSVHYIIESNSRTRYTCELQVRTLAEELWGEVDHKINYPYKVSSIACREQISVLARVTSSCSRLVDSIFRSHEESKTRDEREKTLRRHRNRSRA